MRTEELNKLISENSNVIVKFGAPWCGPCKAMIPILKDIEENHNIKVIDIDIDVDEDFELASEYKIRSIPALYYYKDGVKVDSTVGTVTKEKIIEKF